MIYMIATTIGLCAAAFTLGWVRGYEIACRAHCWNLKFDWKNDAQESYRSQRTGTFGRTSP
jgi:hypothetical protein